MTMTDKQKEHWANSRIAVHQDTRKDVRDLAHGAEMAQGEAVAAILELYRLPGESWIEAGRRLRREFEQHQQR